MKSASSMRRSGKNNLAIMYLLVLFVACWCASAIADGAQHYALEEADLHFEDFINKFEKQYADHLEKAARFEIFKLNLDKINQLNNQSDHAVFGITQFIDLTVEEFIKMKTGLLVDDNQSGGKFCDTVHKDEDIPDANAPESFDWRQQGAVTGVKDQGSCGSCFTFGSTGNIEGQNFIKNKNLVELSEQQILDCDKVDGGCEGGYMSTAISAVAELGGSMLESDYPYEGSQGSCRSDPSKIAVKVSGCISYDLQSQEKLKQLLYKTGPIAIGIRANALMGYHRGVLTDSECTDGGLNHAVLLVGYGIESNKPYWIVKNSWSSKWGEEGYFRLQRSDNQNGACGLLNRYMASAVVE